MTFTARAGQTAGGNADDIVDVPLPGVEFVRRWCLHILPPGYTKTRCYGGWSNTRKAEYLDDCRSLLPVTTAPGVPAAEQPLPEPTDAPDGTTRVCCPHCERPARLVRSLETPGWRLIMTGPDRPPWYAVRGRPGGSGHG